VIGNMEQPFDAFVDEARSFLGSVTQPWCSSFDRERNIEFLLSADGSLEGQRGVLGAAKRWKALECDAGFGCVSAPLEFGGRGLSARYEQAYETIRSEYRVPDLTPFTISIGMVAPTLLNHGSAAARSRYLRRIYRGELVACQLFSEPSAGSDLASVTTRGHRDGDTWIITGQKVWTSRAHLSDVGIVLCRTEPRNPTNRGLTMFLVDMKAPGVEIRPLRQMTGISRFNEVFLDNVRVPDELRLGEAGAGWQVAATTLRNERAAIGKRDEDLDYVQGLVELGRRTGALEVPHVRQVIAEVVTKFQIARWSSERARTDVHGDMPGLSAPVRKLARTENWQQLAATAALILGPAVTAFSDSDPTIAGWSRLIVETPGMRIGGGTDEIMRNVIAERGLGLPREPRL
jgi:alkylation response protein AidB-like acyl-CoA dehydrogenase